MNITVIGAGSWGTTVADILATNGHDILLWTNESQDYDNMINTKVNTRYVPNKVLPKNITVTMDKSDLCTDKDLIVIAVPSHVVRIIAKEMKTTFDKKTIIVNLAKGFEEKSSLRMSEVVKDELGNDIDYIALSGPNISSEIANGLPAGTTIAGSNSSSLKLVQKEFSNKLFKVYINSDLIGVEVGGTAKNVIAIASGFVEGKGLGTNARAQLVTRGMAEIVRLGLKLGAKESTFLGLAGLGDLITTCFSQNSRNFSFGYKVGQGMTVQDALKSTHMVIEGVRTCKVLHELAQKYNLDMPITTEIFKGIYQDKSPDAVLESLLTRGLKEE